MLGKSNKKKHKNMDTQTKTQLMQSDEKAGAAFAAPARDREIMLCFYQRRVAFLTWDSRAM